MRQWELRGITNDLDPTGIEVGDGSATLVVGDPLPTVLWTTDVCLGFTSGPPQYLWTVSNNSPGGGVTDISPMRLFRHT